MANNSINLQPTLQNQLIIARPLQAEDFEPLFGAASDPLIWEQHPNKNRYQQKVFENYFTGAMDSGGALLVSDAATQEVIGSSRYSEYNATAGVISVGYTFFKRSHWGRGYNYALKTAMLDHIFPSVNAVDFYIGADNKRSQLSLERFGAIKIREEVMAYFGEPSRPNFVYRITMEEWEQLRTSHLKFAQVKRPNLGEQLP